jgi:hypothetical protein
MLSPGARELHVKDRQQLDTQVRVPGFWPESSFPQPLRRPQIDGFANEMRFPLLGLACGEGRRGQTDLGSSKALIFRSER